MGALLSLRTYCGCFMEDQEPQTLTEKHFTEIIKQKNKLAKIGETFQIAIESNSIDQVWQHSINAIYRLTSDSLSFYQNQPVFSDGGQRSGQRLTKTGEHRDYIYDYVS